MSQKNSKYDCIVVGGGPAGVSTAYTLSKLGKKVLLLDRKKHDKIGEKTCGDALDRASPQMLYEELGLALPQGDEVSDVLTKLTVSTPHKTITFEAPGYTINRQVYGQRLLKDCENLGVEVIDKATVREVIVEDNFVIGLRYLKNKELIEVRSKLVADCSGVLGAVRSKLPKNFSQGIINKIPDHHIAASFREIMKITNGHDYLNEIVLAYEPKIPPPGYIWFFSKGKDRLNIGTGWLKSENNYDKSMREIYRDALNEYYKPDEYEIEVQGGGLIPIRPPYDCLTFNGGVLVGDAGCLVDPTTAEGHGPALVTGFYAGRTMAEALDKGDISREGLWRYNTDTMAHYGKRNAISYVTLQFLRKIGGEGMDYVLKNNLITEDELEAVFDGEDLDVSIWDVLGKIKRAFPNFGILLTMKDLISNVKKMGSIYDKYPHDPANLASWREKRDKALKEKL